MKTLDLTEYNRGYQDGLNDRGFNDGCNNTQGYVTVMGLNFREHAAAYLHGYMDGCAYRDMQHGKVAHEGFDVTRA